MKKKLCKATCFLLRCSFLLSGVSRTSLLERMLLFFFFLSLFTPCRQGATAMYESNPAGGSNFFSVGRSSFFSVSNYSVCSYSLEPGTPNWGYCPQV